jgi:hypothetical protein
MSFLISRNGLLPDHYVPDADERLLNDGFVV